MTEKERIRRQWWELLAVHVVILAALAGLGVLVLHKAFTPVTAENTTRQLVAFDRCEMDRGDTNLYAGDACYRVGFDAPGLADVLAACGTGAVYEVYTRHVNASEGPDYEWVFALHGADGTAYVTFAEAAADEQQQGKLYAGCTGAAVVLYAVAAVRSLRRWGRK